MCCMYIQLFLLVWCIDRVINAMAAGLVFVDALSVAMLALAELKYEGKRTGSRLNTAVVFLQIVALCGK